MPKPARLTRAAARPPTAPPSSSLRARITWTLGPLAASGAESAVWNITETLGDATAVTQPLGAARPGLLQRFAPVDPIAALHRPAEGEQQQEERDQADTGDHRPLPIPANRAEHDDAERDERRPDVHQQHGPA